MSKIALQGDASGTGTFTIASPNSNTDRTLTLPDEAGTVITSGGSGNVTADMLSSTLDLTGKTVTLPSGVGGKLLQVVSGSNASSITHSNTSYTDVVTVNITPATSGNKLLIIADVNYLIINSGQNTYYPYGQYRFDIGGSATSIFPMYANRLDSNDRQSQQNTFTHYHTVTSGQAGSEITVKVEGRQEASNPTTFLSNNYAPSRLTILEIAQ